MCVRKYSHDRWCLGTKQLADAQKKMVEKNVRKTKTNEKKKIIINT